MCEYVFVCVLLLFFTDCRIHLLSSLAARLFNKITRYSLHLLVKRLVKLANSHIINYCKIVTVAFSALRLLVGRQEDHPACKE